MVLKLLDQRLLPHEEVYFECKDLTAGFDAIEVMVVRGAPCIGFTAIYTLALWLRIIPIVLLINSKSPVKFKASSSNCCQSSI